MEGRPHRSVRARLIGQAGYTLIETLVVMTLLVIVIGSVADAFSSASKVEVDQTARANDQESARVTLQRLRRDLHCASAAQVQRTRDSSGAIVSPLGYTLNLAVDPNICVAVTTSASNTVQWCTVQKDPAGKRYGVYRTISGDCNATDAVFQVDFVTKPDIWTMVCPPSGLQAVAVDMPVNRDPVTRAGRTYELQDTISLRNDSVLGNCSNDT
jgi:prepilin-type N-terminal cleavage/methylation domain-containing protein